MPADGAVNGKRFKPWWICERRNPQLGTYYIAEGRLSKTAANERESPGYGRNIMHRFKTEEAYKDKIRQLEAEGNKVQ